MTCAAGRRDWWVYGYPQYDSRFGTCRREFYGRRWFWSLNGPVIRQPQGANGADLYGNACGGNSGGPVVDNRRGAVTSVMVATDDNCDSNGWGRVVTSVIRGIPGGSPGLSDPSAGVDVYSFWQGF